MIIKYATEKSIKAIAAVDAKCFPPAEAAKKRFCQIEDLNSVIGPNFK